MAIPENFDPNLIPVVNRNKAAVEVLRQSDRQKLEPVPGTSGTQMFIYPTRDFANLQQDGLPESQGEYQAIVIPANNNINKTHTIRIPNDSFENFGIKRGAKINVIGAFRVFRVQWLDLETPVNPVDAVFDLVDTELVLNNQVLVLGGQKLVLKGEVEESA